MISLKKLLVKLLNTVNALKSPPVVVKTWADISTPSAQFYTVCTFTIPATSKYLILARNGNGISGTSINSVSFNVTSGTATSTALGNSGATSGQGGNHVVGWYYVETQTACTVVVQTYGYSSSASMNGRAVAIPLGTAV